MSDVGQMHREALEQFRGSMNLVGPGSIEVHFTDCERALEHLTPTGRWADLGSGAGFPGLVMADRWPELDLVLVDSRSKRCWFLEHVLMLAGRSDVEVLCQRVEALPDASFDGLVSRAFAPPPKVFDHARRLLRPGGRLVFFLQDDAELDPPADFERGAVHRYRVDGKARRSETWVFGA